MGHPLDLAHLGRLLGDPARARMLSRLMDGRALTAGELATVARVTPQTVSSHVRQLQSGGLVRVEPRGRHRFVSLSGPAVARALEALGVLVPAQPGPTRAPEPLRFVRLCFDHLAGKLAVDLTDALERRGVVEPTDEAWELTASGTAWLARIKAPAPTGRRTLARRCLDWSERRDHLAGALGASLAACFLQRRWLARLPDTRALRLTVEGRRLLHAELGLSW
jgi:DNA-binding transcriptional ArsR family regulator